MYVCVCVHVRRPAFHVTRIQEQPASGEEKAEAEIEVEENLRSLSLVSRRSFVPLCFHQGVHILRELILIGLKVIVNPLTTTTA